MEIMNKFRLIAKQASPKSEQKKALFSRSFVHQAVFAILTTTIPLLVLTLWFSFSLQQSSSEINKFYKLNQQVDKELTLLSDTLKTLQEAHQNNQLLQDKKLEDAINFRWTDVKNIANGLKNFSDESAFVADLQQFITKLNFVQPKDASFNELWANYHSLSESLKHWIEHQLDSANEQFQLRQSIFFVGLALLVPLLIATSLFLIIRIRNKIYALENATNQLGLGKWDLPISLSGSAELQQLGEKLDWLRIALKNQHEEKDTFLRHVSHELKTPLASIVEGTSLLQEQVLGPISVQQLRVLEIMVRSSQQLQSLIEDLLRYSGATKLGQTNQTTDWKSLQTELSAYFHDRQQSYSIDIDWQTLERGIQLPYLPCKLALIQMISNAIRYANQTVWVKVKVEHQICIIDVIDDGVGFTPVSATRALEPFYSGPKNLEKQVENNEFHHGLGLTIANECSKTLAGTLKIYPKSGGHIQIAFPLQEPQQ